MASAYSQDLRNRVIDAVEREGMSRRAAARRFGVSESVAVKWFRRFSEDGARKPVGTGGHRPSALKPHCSFLEAVLAEKPDITLEAPSRRHMAGLKKDARRTRARAPGHKTPPDAMAQISASDRPLALGFLRRDLGQNQYDASERVDRQIERLVDALAEGAPAARVTQKLRELERRRLEPRLHPNLAEVYRRKVEEFSKCAANSLRFCGFRGLETQKLRLESRSFWLSKSRWLQGPATTLTEQKFNIRLYGGAGEA
jgi:transposase